MWYNKFFNEGKTSLYLIPCVDLNCSRVVSKDELHTMYQRIYRLMQCSPKIMHELGMRASGLGFRASGLLYENGNDYMACSLLNYNTLYKDIEFATPEFYCLIHIGNIEKYAFDLMDSIIFKSENKCADLSVDAKSEFMDFLIDYTNIEEYLDL